MNKAKRQPHGLKQRACERAQGESWQRVFLPDGSEVIQRRERNPIMQEQDGDLKDLKPQKKVPLHFSRLARLPGVGVHIFVAAAREVEDNEVVFGHARNAFNEASDGVGGLERGNDALCARK